MRLNLCLVVAVAAASVVAVPAAAQTNLYEEAYNVDRMIPVMISTGAPMTVHVCNTNTSVSINLQVYDNMQNPQPHQILAGDCLYIRASRVDVGPNPPSTTDVAFTVTFHDLPR